jgi:NAD-dependent SIR2 family protein deacetylase
MIKLFLMKYNCLNNILMIIKGFLILKELVTKKNNNYFIFTSNIDNQFQKAGFSDEKIYECHGSLSHLQCSGI